MLIVRFLMFLEILSPITKVSGYRSVYCYKCRGLLCDPTEKNLKHCMNSLFLAKARCYFVAWNTSTQEVYRGCYEPEDEHVQECIDNRLTNCLVCQGNGCNDQPIFQETKLSCKQCDWGECKSDDEDKNNYHQCKRFVTGTVPRCVTIFNIVYNFYKFGCENDLTLEEMGYCRFDRYSTTCPTCEKNNCNNIYFFEYYKRPHTSQLRCQGHYFSNICDSTTYSTYPFFACVLSIENAQIAGCFSTLPKKILEEIHRTEHFYLCNQYYCNVPDVAEKTRQSCPFTGLGKRICGMSWACCQKATFHDEYSKQIEIQGCETMIPCWRPEDCVKCCNDLDRNRNICDNFKNLQDHSCFRCSTIEECSIVTSVSMNQTSVCRFEKENGKCFTLLHEQSGHISLYRGCSGDWPAAFDVICENGEGDCKVCEGNLCNSQSLDLYCYVCSFKNNRCRFDQTGSLLTKCPGNPSFDPRSCYINVRYDGLVERGCMLKKDFQCPDNHICSTCNTQACNWDTNYFGLCYRCQGDTSSSCAIDEIWLLNEAERERCQKKLHEPLCYILMFSNGTLDRGCTANRFYKEQLHVLNEEYSPDIKSYFCDTPICNYFTLIRGKSSKITTNVILVQLLILVKYLAD